MWIMRQMWIMRPPHPLSSGAPEDVWCPASGIDTCHPLIQPLLLMHQCLFPQEDSIQGSRRSLGGSRRSFADGRDPATVSRRSFASARDPASSRRSLGAGSAKAEEVDQVSFYFLVYSNLMHELPDMMPTLSCLFMQWGKYSPCRIAHTFTLKRLCECLVPLCRRSRAARRRARAS